jgi:hypothetical protein
MQSNLVDSVFRQSQHFGVGPLPGTPSARACWMGGQGTSPNEQNTQQSPGFGFIRAAQPLQT